MSFKLNISERWAKAIAAAMVVGAIAAPAFSVFAASSQVRDNDPNSIIWGGCFTESECISKMQNGDGHGHSGAEIRGIYSTFGIDQNMFKSSEVVTGTVYKDGRVVVNQNVDGFKAGDVVANNSWSVGRDYVAGSWKEGSVWARYEKDVFVANSIPAFIDMRGGTMHAFMLKSCGNAGKGTPVKPKPSPTPTPTPKPSHTPTPTPTPSPSHTPIPTPTPSHTPSPTPTPSATPVASVECEALTAEQVTDTNYLFTITPKVKNATILGYIFNFSKGTPGTVKTDANTPTTEREMSGNTDVTGQVVTTAGTSPINGECDLSVKVAGKGGSTPTPTPTMTPIPNTPTPTPVPATPSPTPSVLGVTTMPATGPEAALGGMAGLSAIGVASRAYLRSRKSLLDTMRKSNRK